MSPVETLAKLEPWRMNQGQPATPLDPAWTIEDKRALCDGETHHEESVQGHTGWWFCQKCGFCSRSHSVLHRKAQNPMDYYERSLELFYQRRREEGVSDEVAQLQATFIAGAALRYAATTPAEQLSEFIQNHVVIR